ncbi:hypothetical protein RQN30_11585 [Arcanobacterium hippocoleae]
MAGSTAGIAQAAETKELVFPCSQNVTVQSFQAPDGYSIDNIEAELSFLESLPEDIKDEEIALGLGITQPQERIAPLVIVAAIGCAAGVGGAIFNTT